MKLFIVAFIATLLNSCDIQCDSPNTVVDDDMLLTESQYQLLYLEDNRRIGHRDLTFRWQNGVVPFAVDRKYGLQFFS